MHEEAPPDSEKLASIIADSGLKVDRALGPSLLESAYEHRLAHEFWMRGLVVERQTALPMIYFARREMQDIGSISPLNAHSSLR